MKRLATLTLAVALLAPSILAATIDGAWTASLEEKVSERRPDKRPDRLYVSLMRGRSQSVTPELIRELRTLGYDKIDADDLVSMRIHRVTPEYIRQLAKAGYVKIPVEKLVSMRIHNIDAKFVETMSK